MSSRFQGEAVAGNGDWWGWLVNKRITGGIINMRRALVLIMVVVVMSASFVVAAGKKSAGGSSASGAADKEARESAESRKSEAEAEVKAKNAKFASLTEDYQVLREKGDANAALKVLQEMEALIPGHFLILVGYMEVYSSDISLYDKEKAVNALKQAIELVPLEQKDKRLKLKKLLYDLEGGKKQAIFQEIGGASTGSGRAKDSGGKASSASGGGSPSSGGGSDTSLMVQFSGGGFNFWMDKYEVTQGEYEKVMGNNPSKFTSCGPKCPVEQVDWNEATAFCGKLGKRLPTEQEWQYAATSGGKSVEYATASGQLSKSEAHYDSKSPVSVGSYSPNPAGLYDMTGNVWEWTSSDYNASNKIIRGGSWSSIPYFLRASARNYDVPATRSLNIGCRCAK
jgi:hypothetical protein